MKINELEKALGLSKANIRYYESEGLISPKRTENGYRDYSEADLSILKKIIIMRKLGLSIATIKDILSNEIPLHKALKDNELTLTTNLSEIVDMINLNEELLKQDNGNEFDVDYYWEQINGNPNLDDSFTKHDKFIKWSAISTYAILFLVCIAPLGHLILNHLNNEKNDLVGYVTAIIGISLIIIYSVQIEKHKDD